MTVRPSVIALVIALALVAGCQPGAAGRDDAAGRDATPAGVTPSPSSPSPKPKPTLPVTIAFGGDVHFEGVISNRLATDPDTALGPVATVLRRADVAMVNLETAVTTRGTRAPKTYAFRAPSTAIRALRSAGVDVATMANNHGMDYGRQGLVDSLAAARKYHFPVVGIGRDADHAYAPYRTTVHGQRLAFVGATQVLDDNLITAWTATDTHPGLASAKNVDRLVEAVRAARRGADTVIVYLHWGRELERCPLDRQRSLARQLIDAGADVIVGSHAHRLLAGGYLEGRYVHYGLGNFVFYTDGGITAQTGVLTLTVRGRHVTRSTWTPAVIQGGVPQVLHGSAARQARASWEELRDCTGLSAAP